MSDVVAAAEQVCLEGNFQIRDVCSELRHCVCEVKKILLAYIDKRIQWANGFDKAAMLIIGDYESIKVRLVS